MKKRSKVIRRRIYRKRHEASPDIAFDLVIEILRRLPAKSLMRFKSVSKRWSSLICSKYFTDRILKVSSSSPRVYMWLGFFGNSPLENVLLSSSSCPDSDITTMSSFVLDQKLTIESYSSCQVYRGFMCFTSGTRAQIYNTTTRQLVVLAGIEESKIIAEDHKSKSIMYTIGHDPVHDRYKVVSTCFIHKDDGETFMSEHWVLTLGGDVSSRWRKITRGYQPHRPSSKSFTINGRMHYLTWDYLPHPVRVLVTFDISSEEISMLHVPDYLSPEYADLIIGYDGRVTLLDGTEFIDEGVMKLLVMEDVEKNRWSMKTLELHPCQKHMFDGIDWKVSDTTINGEVILVPEIVTRTPRTGKFTHKPQTTNIFHALLYNLEKNQAAI